MRAVIPVFMGSFAGPALARFGSMRTSPNSRQPLSPVIAGNRMTPSDLDVYGESAPRERDETTTTPGGSLSPERLFRALDGRWITACGERWRTEVYSVSYEEGWRWIQVGLYGAREHMLTLRTSRTDGIRQLILALSSWLVGAEARTDTPSVA